MYWLREQKLLQSAVNCRRCGEQMRCITSCVSTDGFVWKCGKNDCGRATLSIRTGSFFFGSRLSIATLISFLYEWARRSTLSSIEFELQISEPTACTLAKFCRDIIMFYFHVLQCDEMIGGIGQTLELDETLVVHRKYNVGRVVRQQWLFGGIIRGSNSQGFLELVPDRRARTLEGVIRRRVRLGTTVMTDIWGGYEHLAHLGYDHKRVNHSQNFLNAEDANVHTQGVKSL